MPSIPQHLLKYFEWESQEKEKSIKEIEANPDLQECLKLIEEVAQILARIYHGEHQNEDENTLSIVALRLSNDLILACDLILSGWWYVDVMIKRDILEVFYLLDYFFYHQEKIIKWKKATRKERLKEFKVGKLWSVYKEKEKEKLQENKGGELTEDEMKRLEAINKKYWFYCELGSHPTYKGICKTSYMEGALRGWCFFDRKQLIDHLKELVTLSGLALDAFVKAYCEENLPQDIQTNFNSRREKGLEWSKRNPGKSYCELDLDC